MAGGVVQRTVVVLLLLAGALLLAVTVWWSPVPGAGWEHAAYRFADLTWPVPLLVALALVVYRRILRSRIAAEIARLAGPSIVRTLPPKHVMAAMLSRIYGDKDTSDVVVGVLGGAGTDPDGGDLTISTYTTVDLELRRIDRRAYELKHRLMYSFKDNVADHRIAIFATCDPGLRDTIALACRLPLYEQWFVPQTALFEKSVDRIRDTVQVGIHYTDLEGGTHAVEPTKVQLNEVPYRDWPDYLTFFREAVGTVPKRSTSRYLSTLRIFEFDLGELADDDHVVDSILSMSITATALQPLDDPFCYWQAPYPCYVERVRFDATGLGWDGDSPRLFRVIPFTFRSAVASVRWLPPEELDDLYVRSWLLPGHGVALMWKPSHHDDSQAHELDEL